MNTKYSKMNLLKRFINLYNVQDDSENVEEEIL